MSLNEQLIYHMHLQLLNFFSQLEINEKSPISDEKMEEERIALFSTQIFFSPINKN